MPGLSDNVVVVFDDRNRDFLRYGAPELKFLSTFWNGTLPFFVLCTAGIMSQQIKTSLAGGLVFLESNCRKIKSRCI